jgi:hypothetical protein
MTHLLIRHKVKDFNKWKAVFDGQSEERARLGCLGGSLYRTVSDPNDVAVVFTWSDAQGAKEFVESVGLRQSMRESGVINPPELRFLDFVEELA